MRTKQAQVLLDSAHLVRAVTSERDGALAKLAEAQLTLAAYGRRTQAEKVAMQMHSKGINTDIEFPALVSNLEKAAEEGRLATIEEAVDLVGPDMSFKTASIHDTPTAGAPGTDLESYLLGSIG